MCGSSVSKNCLPDTIETHEIEPSHRHFNYHPSRHPHDNDNIMMHGLGFLVPIIYLPYFCFPMIFDDFRLFPIIFRLWVNNGVSEIIGFARVPYSTAGNIVLYS